MLTIDFSRRGAKSFTECIYEDLKDRIGRGAILADEKLPSKRALADHLGVSVITVQNAYEQLIAEGYVYSREKKGYFATPLESDSMHSGEPLPRQQSEARLPHAAPQGAQGAAKNAPQGAQGAAKNAPQGAQGARFSEARRAGDSVDLRSNSTSSEKFPFTLWAKLLRAVLNGPQERLLQPIPPQGLEELRGAIAEYVERFRNMSVSADQIVIGAGTEYLYGLIVQLLGRGKTYAVENPGYTKTAAILSANGAACVPVGMDDAGITEENLLSTRADVAHVSPAHHFPTGIVMPVKRRQELLVWAARGGHYIIEDDYDSEFRFTGRPIATLQSADSGGRVIYMNTFSKTLAPSFRISYMILPKQLSRRFQTEFGFYSCTVSSFEQLALAQFIRQGFYEKHLIRMKNYYRNLRNDLISALERSALRPLMEIQEKNAGLHFLLKIDTDKTDAQLKTQAERNGLAVSFLSDYLYAGTAPDFPADGTRTLVVNYSGIRKEQIPQIIARLNKAVAG
ncbi:PLP-dependent aminotransferase family protein [Treponema brennaborense]|uniref:Transcriptional regulator, GntR family n=1 Tax=Treponema brennaborense (strain DSM 12168 / CIP 105900 / DD5/3) TaxID=906968 RepID=F4LQ15_TREBD|nr:PLP-dependent aminotransferase family protein [Treponema brennaborense]AEE17093.1 transcriptional regulator, GntR family [Treponema brennaborense DSM 12168]